MGDMNHRSLDIEDDNPEFDIF